MDKRDLRVDFFRGLALWLILWGHCIQVLGDQHAILRMTPYYWMFSDAFEIFIFLSGYAFGIAYESAYKRGGWFACQVKVINRCWQLYAANIICLVFVMAIVGSLAASDSAVAGHVAEVLADPGSMLPKFLALTYLPWLFQVLPLYVIILLPMPLLLAVARRAPLLALAISGGLYAAAQFYPALNMPSYEHDGATWWFNPFAWQFLFVIGMLLARTFHHGAAQLPRSLWLALTAAAIVMLPVAWRVATFAAARDLAGLGEWYDALNRVSFPYNAGKGHLEPIRLLHFFALAYLVVLAAPRARWFWASAVARPLVLCGKSSLEVFCLGVVLTYLVGAMVKQPSPSLVLTAALAVVAIVVSVVGAMYLDERRSVAKGGRA